LVVGNRVCPISGSFSRQSLMGGGNNKGGETK